MDFWNLMQNLCGIAKSIRRILQICVVWLIKVGRGWRTLLFAKAKSSKNFFRFYEIAESTAESGGKIAESFAESAIPLLSNSLDSFRKRAAPPSPLPLRAKSCRFSLLGGVPRNSVSSKKSAGGTSAPLISDFLHHETGEFWVLRTDLF